MIKLFFDNNIKCNGIMTNVLITFRNKSQKGYDLCEAHADFHKDRWKSMSFSKTLDLLYIDTSYYAAGLPIDLCQWRQVNV